MYETTTVVSRTSFELGRPALLLEQCEDRPLALVPEAVRDQPLRLGPVLCSELCSEGEPTALRLILVHELTAVSTQGPGGTK